jgi:CelD/BcsL family acetyltransferase involved in cellulose biosynthesis
MLPQISLYGPRTVREIAVADLTLQCHRNADSRELAFEWSRLARSTPEATVFQSMCWNRALLQHPQRLGRLRLITVSRGHHMLAVLPLEMRMGGRLKTIGGLMSDYLDPLVATAESSAIWRMILSNLNELVGKRVQSLTLENQSDRQLALFDLASIARDCGFDLHDEVGESVTRIGLADSWDNYLDALDGHERKELRRKLRKAEQAGAAMRVCDSEWQMPAELESLFELMAKGGGGKGRKARWIFPRHFASCAPVLARHGKLRVYRLMIHGRHAAGMIAFPMPHGEILWCGGFDPEMRQLSPGIVLFGMLIRQAIDRGEERLDLLRSPHDYKYRLGGVDYPLYRRMLVRR